METSVEWLIRMLEGQKDEPFDYNEWGIAFKHALDMEKQQILEALFTNDFDYESGEDYYKQTFKSEDDGRKK